MLTPEQVMVLVVAATMVHVTQQQSGLALGAASLPAGVGWAVATWRALLVTAAVLAALTVGGEASEAPLLPPESAALAWAGVALVGALALGLILALRSQRNGGRPGGLVAHQATLTCAWFLVAADFTLFGILLLRFVHDATAFSWYIRHAASVERVRPGTNPLYRRLGLRGIGVPLSVLPLSIAIAAVSAAVLPAWLLLVPVFLHYLIERTVWRRNGVLGRHLAT